MTDYYTNFCFRVPVKTEEQMTWLSAAALNLSAFGLDDTEWPEPPFPGHTLFEWAVREDKSPYIKVERFGNQFTVSDGGESGDVDAAVILMQEYTATFPDVGPIMIEWADFPSRQVINGYGGGGCIVFRGKEKSMSGSYFVWTEKGKIEQDPEAWLAEAE